MPKNGSRKIPRPVDTARSGQNRPTRGKRSLRRYASAMQAWCDRLLGRNLLWSVIVIVLLTPLLSQRECGLPVANHAVGAVAGTSIRAPYDIELPDEQATRVRREAERATVPPVYDFVVGLAMLQQEQLADLFETGRRTMGGADKSEKSDPLARAREAIGPSVPDGAVRLLVSRGFSRELEEAALRVLADMAQRRIVSSREGLPTAGPIAVREVGQRGAFEADFTRLDQIIDLDKARGIVRELASIELPDASEEEQRGLALLVDGFLGANLSYNASETERRRGQAMASVPQVFMRIPKGRVIVREGELFTKENIDLLSRIDATRRHTVDWLGLAGGVILLSLICIFLHRYIVAHLRVFKRVKNLYTMVLLVAFFSAVGTWIGAFIIDAVSERFVAPFNDPASYAWALPIAAGGILITLLANARVAMVSAALNAILFGIVLGWDPKAMVFALVSSYAGIYGIAKYERRTAILKASAWVALVNMALVLAINAMTAMSSGVAPAVGFFELASAAFGGVLVAPVVSIGLPIMEWLFSVLTDIRLLELSNMDNPLLRQLSLQAPGTYNHSIIMGTLAEQAAEEIGAHALLCRVAANYHDIGKMLKPDYFVENMRDGVNKHDKLSPRMSSLIIASHVKEGLRLADDYNLPRQIRDMIPQHHGTRLITFFYRKAKRKEDPDVPEIQESDYRYPGPKPQTREAAIVMMADSVEAAARTVEDPTPAKFEEVINTMTNTIILDHQLDECDLTFSDLGRIRASFLKSLSAVHHHRISYPGFDFDRSKPRAVEAE